MKKITIITALSCLALCAITINACKKNKNTSTMEVRLTDGPTNLLEVNVDIQQVRVKFDDDTSNANNGWITLPTNAKVYNLLNFKNGVDTVLATGPLQQAVVKQIRFVLGSNNTVKDSLGVVHSLTIPSGSESGLKIKISKKLGLTLETLIIDFDAELSIKKEIDGYKLRPVLKIK